MYEKICRACGTRLSKYYQTLMLGCPECYKAFENEILESAKQMHGATIHVGKTPKTRGVDKELLMVYENLLKQREQALFGGDFITMNKLSKEIDELSQELRNRGLI